MQQNKQQIITIEDDLPDVFEYKVNGYLKNGYVIESTSCNCKSWKAILVKEIQIKEL